MNKKQLEKRSLESTADSLGTHETPSAQLNERDVFLNAIEIESLPERKEYVARVCKRQPELYKQVCELLDKHEQGLSCVIDEPLFDASSNSNTAAFSHQIGQIIGPYTLTHLIGHGSMGEVWAATQSSPVRREVAIKLIKPGKESPGLLHRFNMERSALAAMNHPGIARALDVGSTEYGQPYFVMELVEGSTLTNFCDDNRLTVDQRMQVFVKAAKAVHHAHQKGIIHRDLKPSNILVTVLDEQAVPKVIDFGVSKAFAGELSNDSLATQIGMIVGTLAYMPPEQSGTVNQDIDTRADIYSLGVILYELLCGHRPFDAKQMEGLDLHGQLNLIKEVMPLKPSARLSVDSVAHRVAERRNTTVKSLKKLLSSELDWVVMKALEKDRNRRYETASDFATDVQRFLDGFPVEAHPPSKSYRLRKFVDKNKGIAGAISAVLLVVMLGVTGTTYGLFQAKSESAKLKLAEQVALKQKEEAEAARNHAVAAQKDEATQREFAEAIASFVRDDVLALATVEGQVRFEPDDYVSLGKDVTLRVLLNRAADKLHKQSSGLAPEVEAELNWIIGISYRNLCEFEKAIVFAKRAIEINRSLHGPNNSDVLNMQNSLAVTYSWAGKSKDAIDSYQTILDRLESADQLDTFLHITVKTNLAEEMLNNGRYEKARILLLEVTQRSKKTFGSRHQNSIRAISLLGRVYLGVGDRSNSIQYLKQAHDLAIETFGPDNPKTLDHIARLGDAMLHSSKSDDAIKIVEDVLIKKEMLYGSIDHNALDNLIQLANAYLYAQRHADAISVASQAASLAEDKLGTEHLHYILALSTLGVVYREVGELGEATTILKKSLQLAVAVHGEDHPITLKNMKHLGATFKEARQLEQAKILLEKTCDKMLTTFGAGHPETISSANYLANTLRRMNKPKDALAILEPLRAVSIESFGRNDVVTLSISYNLASTYRELKEYDMALGLFKDTYDRMQDNLGLNHVMTVDASFGLGLVYERLRRYEDALPFFENAYQVRNTRLGLKHQKTIQALRKLAYSQWSIGEYAKAADFYKSLFDIESIVFGPRDFNTTKTAINLAVNCLELDRIDDAIEYLELALEGDSGNQKELIQAHLRMAYARAGDVEPLHLLVKSLISKAREQFSPDSRELAMVLLHCGADLVIAKQHDAAEPMLAEALSIIENLNRDLWDRYFVMARIAECHFAAGNHELAKREMVQAYDGMKNKVVRRPKGYRKVMIETVELILTIIKNNNDQKSIEYWSKELMRLHRQSNQD